MPGRQGQAPSLPSRTRAGAPTLQHKRSRPGPLEHGDFWKGDRVWSRKGAGLQAGWANVGQTSQGVHRGRLPVTVSL